MTYLHNIEDSWNVLCEECFAKIQVSLKLLKDENFMKTDKCLKHKHWGHMIMTTGQSDEWPHELAYQSEAEHKQAPQSEANVCRKCNLNKSSFINLHRTPNTD